MQPPVQAASRARLAHSCDQKKRAWFNAAHHWLTNGEGPTLTVASLGAGPHPGGGMLGRVLKKKGRRKEQEEGGMTNQKSRLLIGREPSEFKRTRRAEMADYWFLASCCCCNWRCIKLHVVQRFELIFVSIHLSRALQPFNTQNHL